MTVPLIGGVQDTVDSVARERQITLLHEGKKVVVEVLHEYELNWLFYKTRKLSYNNCVPLLVSHSYKTFSNKTNLSGAT